MNLVNKMFLRLALLPSGLYRQMGVDTRQLKAILNTKLLLDDRRPNTWQQTQRRKQKKPVSFATVGSMILSAVLGFFYLFAFAIGANMLTHLTFYFSMFFFMLAATLISDFTSVLIDVKDTYIILPKPVNDRTFLIARLLHIFIHLCKLVLPMCLPGVVYMANNSGIAGTLLFVVVVFLLTLFVIFFINALYLLMLRVTTPQRFRSIISYVQIVFAITIYASYQLVPRMIERANIREMDITQNKGMLFYPMYWFASTWNTLMQFGGTSSEWATAIAGLLVPLASIFIVIRYLAPSFNNRLSLMSAGDQGPAKPGRAASQNQGRAYADVLSRIFTRSNAERMGFRFNWKMASRSRDFKVKVYPSIGYLLVYVVIMFMNSKMLTVQDIHDQTPGGKIVIISALYFTSLLLIMAINQSVYSEKFKGAWIYYVAPLEKPGEVICGSLKATIFRFYIPIVFVVTIAALVIIGPAVLPNIALGLFNELLIATLVAYTGSKTFPFSLPQNANVRTGAFIRNLFVMVISGLIGIGHYMIYDIMPAVCICLALSITATWLLMSSIRTTTWAAIKSKYAEE
jgi:ABC-2 type transport system permease protein